MKYEVLTLSSLEICSCLDLVECVSIQTKKCFNTHIDNVVGKGELKYPIQLNVGCTQYILKNNNQK